MRTLAQRQRAWSASPVVLAALLLTAAPSHAVPPPGTKERAARGTARTLKPRALAVPKYRAAVYVPASPLARGKRPVVVALHGNFDRPQWACDVWRRLVAGRAFLLCTRGVARRDAPAALDRYSYPSSVWARREIRAALAALVKRHPSRVDSSRVLLVGFSLGATFAAAIARREPRRFSRVLLVEGGHTRWKRAARRFFARGGKAMVLACGGGRCARRAQRACRAARRVAGKGACAAVFARGVGHSYTAPLPARVKPHFDKLLFEPLLRVGAASSKRPAAR